MEQRHILITITGPSGSGKTELSRRLSQQGLVPLVSSTTRFPRENEKHGVDYFYLSREEFQDALASGKFMEDVEYNGILYGVSVAEAERAFAQGAPAVLVAEPHGVEQITTYCHSRDWNVFRVFVDCDPNVLLGRLLTRLRNDLSGSSFGDKNLGDVAAYVEKINLLRTRSATEEDFADVLRQFSQDIVGSGVSLDEATKEKVIQAAAHRITSFDFEQKNWVVPARNGIGYDLVVPGFSQANEKDVLKEILSHLEPDATAAPKMKL